MEEFDPEDDVTYEQGLAAIIRVIGIAILLIVAAIGAAMYWWGFEFVLKSMIPVSAVVGLFVFFDNKSWLFVRIPLIVTVALVTWIFWGWGTMLGIGIAIVFLIILEKSPPPHRPGPF